MYMLKKKSLVKTTSLNNIINFNRDNSYLNIVERKKTKKFK